MRSRIFCAALTCAFLAALVSNVAGATTSETVLSGLDGPVDFAVLPDGSIWWLEYYSGNVTRYDAHTHTREVHFHVEPVVGGERGAVGLGINQDSADNKTFYLYYAVADPGDSQGGLNRLSRIQDGEETILLTTTAAVRHNGGRILLMPDGSLLVSTGENDLGAPAQDKDSLLGKILRVLPDGSAAPGNPHGRMYSYGHRNVYGLAYDPVSKRLFATENSNAERDEVNEILPGRNYGWPECEGTVRFDFSKQRATTKACSNAAYTNPIGEFYANTTVAPTGAAILDGHLYWASWNHGAIHRLDPQPDGSWHDQVVYQYGGRINDLEAAPNGAWLYYSNWTAIVRVPMEAPSGLAPLQPRTIADDQNVPETGSNGRGLPSPSAPTAILALAVLGLVARRQTNRRER